MLLAPAACYKALGYPKDARNARITGYIYLALALGGFYDSLFTLCTIGAPPIPPKTDGMSEDEALQAIYDYTELRKLYQQQKEAFSLHVPYADYMQIKNYLDKYFKTLQTTSAVKGNRFYAFTKNSEKTARRGFAGNA